MTDDSLSSHAQEMDFAPDPAFTAQANGTAEMYDEAAADHEGFWARQARERISWATDFEQTLDWSEAPFAKWFVGGRLNVAYNCVDRHVEAGNGERVAIHFEGEPTATPAPSPTPTCSARWPRPPTRWSPSAWARATGSRSTCR